VTYGDLSMGLDANLFLTMSSTKPDFIYYFVSIRL